MGPNGVCTTFFPGGAAIVACGAAACAPEDCDEVSVVAACAAPLAPELVDRTAPAELAGLLAVVLDEFRLSLDIAL
jgi:hypothetical protein